jgi:ATP-dependent Clp protease adaptor protein ClpS
MAETKTRDEVDIDTEFDFISPGMYKVVVQNDDYTPMDFVIAVMMHIFKHNEERAKELTIQIHEEGSAVAGVYTYEVAEQKGVESTMLARQNGWPLAVRVEEE